MHKILRVWLLFLVSSPVIAAEEAIGFWELKFLWEGEEDDAPIVLSIAKEKNRLIGTATSDGKVIDAFDIARKRNTLSFSANFDDVALLDGYTYHLNIRIAGNRFNGTVTAKGMKYDIRAYGRRTRADSTPEFTIAQVASGKKAYHAHCASCHGTQLKGIGTAPALKGPRFDQSWRGKEISVVAFHLRRMPPGQTDQLSDTSRLDTLAFLLAANGLTPTEEAMPSKVASLGGFVIPLLPDQMTDADAPGELSKKQLKLLSTLPTLTSDALYSPAADDWLHWAGDVGFHNFSTLDDINRDTVKNLKPVWRTQLTSGRGNPAPLVHQGVMYLQTFPDRVLAIDAATGQILWRYQHETGGRSTKKMGIALKDNRVFVSTTDMKVVALDARTGDPVWLHSISDDNPSMFLGNGPLIAGETVVQGTMGYVVPGGPYIVGIDIETGKEKWRFHAIARPGATGGNSWNDLPLARRRGGNFWHQATYDPDLNLVYVGPAATYDLAPLRQVVNKPGITNDALFTGATLALNADTGKLAWYFQHLRNDQWNFDQVYPRQIIELSIAGKHKKVMLNTGKMAMTDALDAETGDYLFSMDAGMQNIVESLDPISGVKQIKPEAMPIAGASYLIYPNHYGARSWAPIAYNPISHRLYLPLAKGAQIVDDEGWHDRNHPDSANGMGRMQAMAIPSGDILWQVDTPSPLISGSLATHGGLVFAADLNRRLRAYDDTSGNVLWQTELDDLPNSNIITFAVDGKQYVAIVVGLISDYAEDWEMTYRRFAPDNKLPMNESPKGGAAVWAFALE